MSKSLTKEQVLDIADKIKTLSIESGAWVEVEREFNKANKLERIRLIISIAVNHNKGAI